jgi:hypothetical protein
LGEDQVITFNSVIRETVSKARRLLFDVLLYGEAQKALADLGPEYRQRKTHLDDLRHKRNELYLSWCEWNATHHDKRRLYRRIKPRATRFELQQLEGEIHQATKSAREIAHKLVGLDDKIVKVRPAVYSMEREMGRMRQVALPAVPSVLVEWLGAALSEPAAQAATPVPRRQRRR